MIGCEEKRVVIVCASVVYKLDSPSKFESVFVGGDGITERKSDRGSFFFV